MLTQGDHRTPLVDRQELSMGVGPPRNRRTSSL